MKMAKVSRQCLDECGKGNLPSLYVRATEAALSNVIVDPRTTPDNVRNVWKEVIEALSALIDVHRNLNGAKYDARLSKPPVRVAAMTHHSVAVAHSESREARVERGQMLTEPLIVFDRS